MINVLLDLIHTYLNLYQISLTLSFIFLWIALSYVDRVHLRERSRRFGLYISTIIAYLLLNSQFYDKFRVIFVRPLCAIFETITGFLEGVENFEATILLVDNNDMYLQDIETAHNDEKTKLIKDISVSSNGSSIGSSIGLSNASHQNLPDPLTILQTSVSDVGDQDRYRKITTHHDVTAYHKMNPRLTNDLDHGEQKSSTDGDDSNSTPSITSGSDSSKKSVIDEYSKNRIDPDQIGKILNPPTVKKRCDIEVPMVSDDEKSEDLCSKEGENMGKDNKVSHPVLNNGSRHTNGTGAYKKVTLSSGVKNTQSLAPDVKTDVKRQQKDGDKDKNTGPTQESKRTDNDASLVKVDKAGSVPQKDVRKEDLVEGKTKKDTVIDAKQVKSLSGSNSITQTQSKPTTRTAIKAPSDSEDDDSSDSEESHQVLVDKNKIVKNKEKSKSKSKSKSKDSSKAKNTRTDNKEEEQDDGGLKKRKKVPIRLVRRRHQN